MKVAIIEDDISLSLNIAKKLKRSWYDCIVSNSIEEFKSSVLDDADLFIIDIWLWDASWFEIVKWLREDKNNSCPILIMSWYSDIDNKLKWFKLWIDDYISKPVIPEELVARVSALFRRWSTIKKAKVKYNNLTFDFNLREVILWDDKVLLTRKELQIVEFFLLNKWRIITKAELVKSVWWTVDLFDVTYNTINVTICKMRKKLWEQFNLNTVSWIWYILNNENVTEM